MQQPPAKPQAIRPAHKRGGGGGFPKLIFILLLTAAGAFFYGVYHYQETPEQFWERIVRTIERLVDSAQPTATTPPPAPAPSPGTPPPEETQPMEQTHGETMPVSETVEETPPLPPPAAETPAPRPDSAAWIMNHRELLPSTLNLSSAVAFPITVDGKQVGAVTMPAGTKVYVKKIEPGFATVTSNNRERRIPLEATDFSQRADAALAWFEAKTKTYRTVTETAAPAPAYRPTGQSTPVQDDIVFGDDLAEKKHGLKAELSETLHGGLGQPARQLLPGGAHPWEGGTLEWTMKVDPNEQNYVTVKLWGSDQGEESGRLVLFANGLQVGYRHESDYDVLNQCDDAPLAPGRFVYATLPLPPKLTQGKTSITLKIVSIGRMWPYGTTFSIYQKNLTQPTRGIYRAYTHTTPRFSPAASEQQGIMPDAPIRRTPGEEVIEKSKDTVKDRLAALLAGKPKGGVAELSMLGESYNVRWAPSFKNPRVIAHITADGDALVRKYAAEPSSVIGNWVGAGPLGKAIVLTWPAIGQKLDGKITVGPVEMTRRKAWANLLHDTVEFGRTHRRSFTNQSIIVDLNIYTANRALQLMADSRALPEAKTLNFLYQSAGITPWLGSDQPDGGSEKPLGKNYYLITRKGLSRELGYVATYGETILPMLCEMTALTGDPKLRDQLSKMQAARLFFRYPSLDNEGYASLKIVSEIDNRTAHYPVAGSAYNNAGVRESWWMETAAALPDDPVAVGGAQQSVADGHYFAYIASRLGDPDTAGMMKNVEAWEKVEKLPKSTFRIPMTPGQPDTAFADEEDGVLALKRGDDYLFINLYYRADRAVNRVARVFEQTPRMTRIATVRTDVEVIGSGETYERPDWIDWTRNSGKPPPGQSIHQAWAGEKMPISKRPDDAKSPSYGDWGPFVGKAAFYSLRYGDYLIGMNTTEDRHYTLNVPAEYHQAPDLISGKQLSFSGNVDVPPLSTVVLYLGKPGR